GAGDDRAHLHGRLPHRAAAGRQDARRRAFAAPGGGDRLPGRAPPRDRRVRADAAERVAAVRARAAAEEPAEEEELVVPREILADVEVRAARGCLRGVAVVARKEKPERSADGEGRAPRERDEAADLRLYAYVVGISLERTACDLELVSDVEA